MEYKQGEELREFSHLYKELSNVYHSISLKLGLSDSAFDILYTICTLGPGCSQTEICEWVSLSKQTINSSIRKLEGEGYIRMERGKGRALHIHLTESGHALAQEKILPVIQMENDAFRKMTSEESQAFLRLTRKYLAGMREEAVRRFGIER